MASQEYLVQKKRGYVSKSVDVVDVVDLIDAVKVEEKKEKRHTILIATAALSALVISGFIISL